MIVSIATHWRSARTDQHNLIAGVQPWWVSGSPKDGQCRQRMRGQTPSLMPENGQPLWVWLNSKSLIKLYFYRDLLHGIKGTSAWHDFSSRKSLYRNTKKMYRKFYRFVHTKQKLFWRGGLSIRQLKKKSNYMYKVSNVYIDHLMSNKVFRIWHRSKRYTRLVSGYMWTIKGLMWLGFLTQPSIFLSRFFLYALCKG